MSTPASRTLTQVLLTKLAPSDGVSLMVGQFASPPGSGAYRNVVLQGATVTVPALSGSAATAGGPAYLLATRDFLLCIGTVA